MSMLDRMPFFFKEFVSVHRNTDSSEAERSKLEVERPEAVYFRTYLDGDKSGFLDVEEIAKWVEPTGFVQVDIFWAFLS